MTEKCRTYFRAFIFLPPSFCHLPPDSLTPSPLAALSWPATGFSQRLAGLQQALEAGEDVRPASRNGLDQPGESAIAFSFELFLEFGHGAEAALLELANPPIGDLVDRHGVEVMQFFAAPPDRDDKRCLFQELQVLGHGLAGHVEVFAKLGERLPVIRPQAIQQQPPAGIGQP